MMKHRKRSHADKVAQCTLHSGGNCFYGEELCWFNHNDQVKMTSDFICKVCNKTFQTRSRVMLHMKHEHSDNVQKCRSFSKGDCGYTSCWFKHDEKVERNMNEVNTDHNITDKLFEIMEKFAGRLKQIEEHTSISTENDITNNDKCI